MGRGGHQEESEETSAQTSLLRCVLNIKGAFFFPSFLACRVLCSSKDAAVPIRLNFFCSLALRSRLPSSLLLKPPETGSLQWNAAELPLMLLFSAEHGVHSGVFFVCLFIMGAVAQAHRCSVT